MAGGRPTKYKEEYCEELIAHMAEGFSYESFAGRISVSKQTIYDWEKKFPKFVDAKKIGRAKQQYKMEQICLSGIWSNRESSFNNTIVIWFMKNTCGWRDNPDIDNSPPEQVMEDID